MPEPVSEPLRPVDALARPAGAEDSPAVAHYPYEGQAAEERKETNEFAATLRRRWPLILITWLLITGSVTAVGQTYALNPTSLSQSLDRTNMFVGASINLPIFRLAAEYGQQSGGSVAALTNGFGDAADASRSYFSVGIRLKF